MNDAAPELPADGDVLSPMAARQHRVLAQAAGQIAAAGDLEAALRAVFTGVRDLAEVDGGSVRIPAAGPEADFSTYREFRWMGGDEYVWRQGQLRSGGDTERLLQTGKGQYVADLAEAAEHGSISARLALDKYGVRSGLRVPLRAGGRIVGVLYANSRRPNAYSAALLVPVQVLADHAGAAVAHAQLRTQTREQLRRLQVAQRVSSAVNTADDLDGMLTRVLDEATRLVGAQRGTVALVDVDRLVVRGRVGVGLPPGLLEATVRQLYDAPHFEEDIYACIVRTGEQAIVEDDHPALHRRTMERFGLYNEHRVFTPIRHAGVVIGVLTVSWTGDGRSSDENLALLRLIAEQAGSAIARARLVEAERAQLQARLEAEARFRAMFQESPIPTFNWRRLDGTWILDEYNPVAERFTAGRFAVHLGRPVEAVYPDLPQFADQLRRCAAERVALTWELRYPMRSTDERRDLILSFVAVTSDLVMVHAQDITERQQAADALARQYRAAEAARGEARAILDATEEGIVLMSPDGRYLSANRRFAELFEVDQQELIGRNGREFADVFDRVFDLPNRGETFAAYLVDPETVTKLDLRQHWPVQRDLTLYSTPVRAATGEPLGRLFAFRDVTRERSADRLKDEFISMVSHELHTPLTAIKGYVGILLADTTDHLSTEQREFLSIIEDSTDREVTLVNDLLDISRLEAGHINVHPRPLDLSPLLRQVAATLRPQCRAKGQQIIIDVPPSLPLVAGDATRLTQVFTNLLVNAHKYTPPGGRLTITAAVAIDDVRVDVQDTGVGLTPEEQGKLFTKFYRANNPITQEVSGTGLGLVITRALVERHGGQITVASAPGQGSTFSVILPFLTITPEPAGTQ